MGNLGVAIAVAAVFLSLSWVNVENAKSQERITIAKMHCAAVRP